MLDIIASERLRQPSPWELAQYRRAKKPDRRSWEDAFDGARFCYAAEDALQALECELRDRRADKLWCGAPSVVAAATCPTELVRDEYYLARNQFSWFRPDARTPGGGPITGFPDRVVAGVGAKLVDANHALSNSAPAEQVADVANGTALPTRPCATFTGVQQYRSSITGWSFTADGTGFSARMVMAPTTVAAGVRIFMATTSASNNQGFHTYFSAGLGTWTTYKDGALVFNAANFGTAVASTAYVVRAHYASADTPQYHVRLGNQTDRTGSLTAPSVGATNHPLQIGALGASGALSSGAVGEFYDLLIANQTNAALLALTDRYCFLRYGLS